MMLSVQGVTVSFGGARAVDGASIRLAAGEIVGLAGPNGAGKSSLFAAIGGQVPCEAGTILLGGHDVTHAPVFVRARMGLGRTFQVPREFGRLSVQGNLLAAASNARNETVAAAFFARRRIARDEEQLRSHAAAALELLGLDRVAHAPAAALSGGQKKLLELGRALMAGPRVLLLDEPFAGVDAVLVQQIVHALLELKTRGLGLVVVDHDLQALRCVADRLVMMDGGKVLAEGPAARVLADPRVWAAYLGESQ